MAILGLFDWITVGIYFILIGGISVWSIRRKKDSPSDYFLANRNLGWFVIGASILASNVGSEHIVGLAGTGAKSGLAMGHYELHSWIVLTLGWVFVPFYMRSKVFTMPEFLERRYNNKTRWLLSIVQLLSYVIAKASVTIYAGAVVFNSFLGVDFWTGAIVLIAILGFGLQTVFIAIGVLGWPSIARVFRSSILSVKENEYVDAARAMGASTPRILFRHIMPNAVAPIIVYGTMSVGGAILTEAALSFLGVGVQPPSPSWGSMLNAAQRFLTNAPWMAIWPGVALAFVVYGVNMFGDALRDILDLRLRGGVGRDGVKVKKANIVKNNPVIPQ